MGMISCKKYLKPVIRFLEIFIILLVIGFLLPKFLNIILEYIKFGYPHVNSTLVSSNSGKTMSFINIFIKYIHMYFIW